MEELFTVTSGALSSRATVLAVRATEMLSRPYQIDAWIAVPSEGDHELSEAIGGTATLSMNLGEDDDPFHFHGVITSARFSVTRGDNAVYHLVLVPRLRLLSQSRHSRIFTKKAIPDVISAVLERGGVPASGVDLRLTADYQPEEHVTQYQESDLDFIQRWMELEGMYYFFEHEDGDEKLVICDAKSAHEALRSDPVRYHPAFGGDRSSGDAIARFSCEQRALPAAVKLADYDYGNPTLDVSARADVSRTGYNEVVVHNARFFDPGAAKRYAKVRAEELLAEEVVFEATGSATKLRAGALFELVDHPNSAFEGKYLVTEARHASNLDNWSPDSVPQGVVYRVSIRAIRADVQYRARRTTAWPHIYGIESGTIDGPAKSEYAQIDDHGRYAVKIHFDESDLKDGKASTWMRMAQPHGGTTEGFHFPLRKGTEVMLAFAGGDPDRPVIVGVAPNALTPSPVTRENHTTNIIQTGGRNRMELEDKNGGQRATMFSPTKNSYLRMGAPNDDVNAYLSTDGNAKIEVGGACGPPQLFVTTVGAKDERVEGTVTETYTGPFKTTVTNATEEHYGAKKTETVHGALVEKFNTSQTTTVTLDVTEKYKTHSTHVTSGARIEKVGGAVTETYTGPLNRTVTNLVDQTFGSTYKLDVTGAQNDVAGSITRLIILPLDTKVKNEKKEIELEKSAKIVLGGVTEILVGGKSEILIGGMKAETVLGLKKGVIGFKMENELSGIGNEPVKVKKKAGKFVLRGAECNSVAGAVIKIANAVSTHGGGFLFKN